MADLDRQRRPADPANPTDGKPRRRDYEPQRRHHRPHGGRLIKRRRGTARFHTALLTDTFPRTTFTDADLAASCEACQLPSLRPVFSFAVLRTAAVAPARLGPHLSRVREPLQ
jgi:hypothetical protein